MMKRTSALVAIGLSALLFAACGNRNNQSESHVNTVQSSSSKSNTSSRVQSSSSSNHKSNKTAKDATNNAAPISYGEGEVILLNSIYRDYGDYTKGETKFVSNDGKKTVISVSNSTDHINYFTLTPYGTNQVKITAKFGENSSGSFTELSNIHTKKETIVDRPSSYTTSTLPSKFVGKWKKSDGMMLGDDDVEYEEAYLYHGKPKSVMFGKTYTDAMGYDIISCTVIGNNDCIVTGTESLTHSKEHIYLHYSSENGISAVSRTNLSDKGNAQNYDSQKPVNHYQNDEW